MKLETCSSKSYLMGKCSHIFMYSSFSWTSSNVEKNYNETSCSDNLIHRESCRHLVARCDRTILIILCCQYSRERNVGSGSSEVSRTRPDPGDTDVTVFLTTYLKPSYIHGTDMGLYLNLCPIIPRVP